MNEYTLLLKTLTGSSVSGSSKLELVDNYYLYRQTNGGGVVDEFNVKVYLDDPDNSIISGNFFRYVAQFKEIFYDDKKLSNIFNKYYNTSVIVNSGTPTSVINLELTGTTAITEYYYYKNWDGRVAPHTLLTGTPMSIFGESGLTISQPKLLSTTLEESYYIPVYIGLSYEPIAQMNFSEYCKNFIRSGKTITQGFVDINYKVNYDVFWFTSMKEPDRATAGTPGLDRLEYRGSFERMPNFSKIDPISRTVATSVVHKIPNAFDYALRFLGYFYANIPGTYTFCLNSDDGSFMYIGDVLLIKNDGLHGPTIRTGVINLKAGYHKIDIQYFQKQGGSFLQFLYLYDHRPGNAFIDVGASLLSH